MTQTMTPPTPALAEPAGERGWVRGLNMVGPLIGLALVVAFFMIVIAVKGNRSPLDLVRWGNVEMMLIQTVVVGIAALGMTMVIVLGGIDLSVGSMIALSGVTVALVLRSAATNAGTPQHPELHLSGAGVIYWPLLAVLAAMGLAAVCGLVNGVLVARLRMLPFIVTLGMMGAVRGGVKGLAHETTVYPPKNWLAVLTARGERPWAFWVPDARPEEFGGPGRLLMLPVCVWLLALAALLTAGVLRYARMGRHIFAVGSNEQTARLCGVPVERLKITVYTLMGAFAGLAGVIQSARLSMGDPTDSMGRELDVIAAVVIGGGSLNGGEGSVLGSIMGALIMTVIRTGCSFAEWPNWVQEVATGAIIVVAVGLDRWRHQKMS